MDRSVSNLQVFAAILGTGTFLMLLLSLLHVIFTQTSRSDRADVFLFERRNEFVRHEKGLIYTGLAAIVDSEFVAVKLRYADSERATWFGQRPIQSNGFPKIWFASIERTVYFDNESSREALAKLVFYYDISKGFLPVFGLWIASFAVVGPIIVLFGRRINRSHTLALKAKRDAAIAETTQMLAHDIRRPFTMIKGFLDMITAVKDPAQAAQLVGTFKPEIDKTIAGANSMIADVMEVGTDEQFSTSPVEIAELIRQSLKSSFRFDRDSRISFEYELRHKHKVNANEAKLARVVSNIAINAAQAMKGRGKIWFHTLETEIRGERFVQLTIGNSGSHIPPNDIPRLFDAFYTKGKKAGTGLGLAIAKKVTEGHGGKIWCTSDPSWGVAFHLTIPTTPDIASFDVGQMIASTSAIG